MYDFNLGIRLKGKLKDVPKLILPFWDKLIWTSTISITSFSINGEVYSLSYMQFDTKIGNRVNRYKNMAQINTYTWIYNLIELLLKGIQEYLQSKINFTEPGWNHE